MSEDRQVIFVPKAHYDEADRWPELAERACEQHWSVGAFTRDETGNKQMPETPSGHASFYNGFRDAATLFYRNW